ncbi:MAG TPA: hypothetical protein VKB84_22395 [Candidatus Binataceae bacterium]|jgi:hypothetical protein|nr:hypothetical protein [Candidatus Binataceae bacterium]
MPGSIDNLKLTLSATINAFNTHDWASVQRHMADDAVVRSIGNRPHNPGASVKTYTAVSRPTSAREAIQAEFVENAYFEPIGQIVFNPPSGSAQTATISGVAHWTDIHGVDHIKFTFGCVFDSSRGWLFQDISATAG